MIIMCTYINFMLELYIFYKGTEIFVNKYEQLNESQKETYFSCWAQQLYS